MTIQTFFPTFALPGRLPKGFVDITEKGDPSPQFEDPKRGLVIRFMQPSERFKRFGVLSMFVEDEGNVYELETDDWSEVLLFVCDWPKKPTARNCMRYSDLRG